MLITDIVAYQKNKYKIYVDHEFAFVLYKGELHKYHLEKDVEIDAAVYAELTKQILPKRAKLRAMHLLTKRPYTEYQLRQKLREGMYPDQSIESAMAYVKSFGYIDDEAYARDYISYHLECSGIRNIEQKLQQKGIDSKLIGRILGEMDPLELSCAQTEQIRALFQKKYKGCIPEDAAQKNKMINFFLRKGYSVSEVKRALKEISLDEASFT